MTFEEFWEKDGKFKCAPTPGQDNKEQCKIAWKAGFENCINRREASKKSNEAIKELNNND